EFDKDVAEAAAAAAAANVDPFYEEEERNAGANWDPRRASSNAYGYGRLHDDPFYGGAGVGAAAVGAAGAAGVSRQPTNQFQQNQYQHDAYGMSDLRSNAHTSYSGSSYPSTAPYGAGAGYYMNDMPQAEYPRPSFSSAAPGIAGVGSMGAGAAAYGQQQQQQDQNLRYRGQPAETNEDAYGGYAPTGPSAYPNPYDSSGTSAAHTSPTSPIRSTVSPPPNVAPAAAPPSYSGHGHGSQNGDHSFVPPTGDRKVRPLSSGGGNGTAPMAINNMPQPSTSGAHTQHAVTGTPDERWGEDRILRVANE
ncbi:hypothetical protein FS842_001254, partial [Serendipita sp. 407]